MILQRIKGHCDSIGNVFMFLFSKLCYSQEYLLASHKWTEYTWYEPVVRWYEHLWSFIKVTFITTKEKSLLSNVKDNTVIRLFINTVYKLLTVTDIYFTENKSR